MRFRRQPKDNETEANIASASDVDEQYTIPLVDDTPLEDPTAWLLESAISQVLIMSTTEIKYMAMFGYTFLHGYKLFPTFKSGDSFTFKFVSMIFACTGGGILVPIFINAIPVSLAQDAYPVAIIVSFLLHYSFPILREVLSLSPVFKAAMIVLYEVMRASVVVKFTYAASHAIPASDFSIAIFGPIFCGTIGGCGGAFLPMNKGLDPIRKSLGQPMVSAFFAATFTHLFLNTSLSDGVVDAKKKVQLIVVCYFIAYNMTYTFGHMMVANKKTEPVPAKVPATKPNTTTTSTKPNTTTTSTATTSKDDKKKDDKKKK